MDWDERSSPAALVYTRPFPHFGAAIHGWTATFYFAILDPSPVGFCASCMCRVRLAGLQTQSSASTNNRVQIVEELGGKVFYKHELDRWDKPAGSPWLRERLGAHFFDRVVHVSFSHYPGELKGVKEISCLEPMSEMRELFLCETSVSDISVLSNKTHLHFLSLMRTRVRDLRPLAELDKLTILRLDGCPVEDVKPLSKLKLERVSLRETMVDDISDLNMSHLVALDLFKTPVKDLSPLENAIGLETLDLDWTDVADFQILFRLRNLKQLNVSRTKIGEEELARLRRALPDCDIRASWSRDE